MEAVAAILTIGSEILDGRILDTNSKWVSELLSEHGIRTSHILSCDDNLDEIKDALGYLSGNVSIIIISGGLGPTSDDLTAEALAKYLDVPLVLSQDVLSQLKERYAARGRTFDPQNEKQAYFPQGVEIIPNEWGTAPGSYVTDSSGTVIASLPGVPRELKGMMKQTVIGRLLELGLTRTALLTHSFKTFGIPESTLGGIVAGALRGLELEVSYRPTFPEVQVQLRTESKTVLKNAIKAVRQAVRADFIFTEDPEKSYIDALHEVLLSSKLSVATAESCTGGMIGGLLTRTPGSSSYFNGGIVSYSNAAKEQLLGVSTKTLEQYGAVSHQTAREMAIGARSKFNADVAVSVTGVAGPDGGSESKPVGTFHIGCASVELVESYLFFFLGTREGVRRFAMYSALDILRRRILKLPINPADNFALTEINSN